MEENERKSEIDFKNELHKSEEVRLRNLEKKEKNKKVKHKQLNSKRRFKGKK